MKLDMQGTTLKAYVNGTQLLTQTDSSCTSGSVGVGSVGASFESDDVRVTAPTTNACVQNWSDPKTNQCGAFCTGQTQNDRLGCGAHLDCYANNGCSPETCGGDDDVCGVHKLNPWGNASKEVADQVYKCLGCAGSVNCANPKYYNGTVCADGNACTWGDTCQNKVCTPDPNRNTQCTAADQCHGVGTCSTTSGQCSNPEKANGTGCDDGIACTKSDQCTAGACAGTAVTCLASDQCHGVGTCSATDGVCSNPTLPDNTSCSDGNDQTQGDSCTMGSCQGTQACSQVGSVAVGGSHTCTVRSDGSLWCWGANGSGQLGTGSTDPRSVPVRVGASTWRWNAVAGGESFTCAIRIDGTLWCWGDNSTGQLGFGTIPSSSIPRQVWGTGWVAVQAGQKHACGVRSTGALLCWGDGTFGALGNGTYDGRNSPTEVAYWGWVGVSAGTHHTCGLRNDHTIWCWGQNSDGRLGTGTSQNSPLPVQASGTDWSGVAAGGVHTCAVRLDGTLWCWGGNASGQLGTGSNTSQVSPTQIGSATWTTVSAGTAHACAVQTGGTLWCWGANDDRQLGDGTGDSRLSPVRIPGQSWANVSTSTGHTCGRRADGSLWCWGDNQDGEVGDGTTGNMQPPEQIVGSLCGQVPICGNGTVEPGEECDDGNNTSNDGCSFDCKLEKCFGVVCTGSDDCHGVCNPATGECSNDWKPEDTPCNDHDACTKKDVCRMGTCQGQDPVGCTAQDPCHSVGTCDKDSGECTNPPIDKMGCNINLRMDGVVDINGDGSKYIALFGHKSSATTNYHPGSSVVTVDGVTVSNPQPPPPYNLIPGDHPGSFMPTCPANQTITWTVDGQPKTANCSDLTLRKTTTDIGTGKGVDIGGGVIVMLT